MNQNHLIYKQVFEVEFSSRKEALDGQNRLSQFSKKDLLDQIEQVFDKMVSPDDFLRIQRLEVDLGELSASNFEEDIAVKLTSQLQDQLRRQMQYTRRKQGNGRSKSTSQKDQDAEEVYITSSKQRAIEQFTHFIQTGRYPWWAGKTTAASPDILAEKLIHDQPDEFEQLFSSFYKSETYSRRLVHQLSDATLEKILQLISGDPGIVKKIRSIMKDFLRLHGSSPLAPLNRANFRLLIWRTAFDIRLKGIRLHGNDQLHKSDPNVPKSWKISRSEQSLQVFLFHLLRQISGTSGKRKRRIGRTRTFQMQIRFLLLRVSAAGMTDRPLGKLLKSAGTVKPAEWKSFLKDVDTSKRDQQVPDNSPQVERLEVNNAGLVLIAPFLPIFFDALGLLKEKEFITPQASGRAALILQFIATGITKMPEHELVLNKILCGIDIEEPLPRRLDLGDHEIEEINNLLDSVIEHWSALKGTSVRGLRDTFINREGYLVPQQNGWKLFVERITPDVLIDRLPWSISNIKLPWTNDIIHTEW